MLFLRQSTAVDIAFGPMIDDDGITPATGLSITQAETRLKKNNGAWAQASDNTTATHEEEGWYEKELDATDTNTCGHLIVAVYISGNLACWKEFQVVEEAVYDAFFAASALGYVANAPVNVAQFGGSNGTFASGRPEVNTSHIAGSAVSTSTAQIGVNVVNAAGIAWGSGAITAASIANGAIDAATFAADVDAEILSYIVDDATRIDASALNTATGTTIPAILTDTAEIGAAGAGLTVLATQASVNTIDDLLDTEIPALTTAVADLPTNAELATALGTADDAVLAQIALVKAVTDALPDAGALTSLATAANLATVDTVVDAIKAKTDSLTFTTAGLVDANVQQINDVTITGDGQVGTEFGV